MALKLMLLLLAMKLVVVATSYASGNAGGIFGPSLFLGAMLGGAIGTIAQHFLPGYVASPGAYALVGMGTAFAGVVRAPMTSVLMIFETTRDYAVIVPLMISNLISYFIASKFQKKAIYEILAEQDGVHLPSAETRIQEGLRQVYQAMQPATEILSTERTVAEALEKIKESKSTAWPCNDETGVVGVITLETLQKAANAGGAARCVAELLDARHFPHVHADHSLTAALDRMGAAQLDLLPVVSRADLHKLEGVITLQDVLKLYGVGVKPPV
jgi:CIC family chloride channel protein